MAAKCCKWLWMEPMDPSLTVGGKNLEEIQEEMPGYTYNAVVRELTAHTLPSLCCVFVCVLVCLFSLCAHPVAVCLRIGLSGVHS